MKKLTLLSLSSLLGLAIMSTATIAYADMPADKNAAMMKNENNFNELNLTIAQKTQIKQIYAAAKPQMKSLKADMSKNDQALNELAVSTDADQAKITELSEQQGKLIGQMIALKTNNTNKIYNILTSDQQKKFKAYRQQRMEKINKMMSNMRHGQE